MGYQTRKDGSENSQDILKVGELKNKTASHVSNESGGMKRKAREEQRL